MTPLDLAAIEKAAKEATPNVPFRVVFDEPIGTRATATVT